MLDDLKNKTILVTGASRGIGAEISKKLCSLGAHVIANYRTDNEHLHKLKNECKVMNGQLTCLQFDIVDLKSAKEQINNFLKNHGPIHGLVNNAGISKDTLALRVKEEEVDQILSINLKSAMMITNFLTRNFLKTKSASVVNISSIVGLMGNASQTVYSASKAGLIGYKVIC